MKDKVFYVYYHINPITQEVFYVGKGCKSRAYEWSCRRSREHYEVQDKIKASGQKAKAVIVETFISEIAAYKAEKQHIKNLMKQGSPLVNKVEGGRALSGRANPMYGKKRLDTSQRNKLSKGKSYIELYGAERAAEIAFKVARNGKDNGMFGKSRDDLAQRNRENFGKNYDEIFGSEQANSIRAKLGGIKIVRNDGATFYSIKSAAKAIKVSKYLLKRHLDGHIADLNNYTFQYVK